MPMIPSPDIGEHLEMGKITSYRVDDNRTHMVGQQEDQLPSSAGSILTQWAQSLASPSKD